MQSRFFEINGQIYEVQTNKVSNRYEIKIIDNDDLITSFTSDVTIPDDRIRQMILSKIPKMENPDNFAGD
jgi:hypothetical protein